MLSVSAVISLAQQHAGTNGSALLCISDALTLRARGFDACARERALTSLAHSVGVFAPDYARAKARNVSELAIADRNDIRTLRMQATLEDIAFDNARAFERHSAGGR